MRCVTLLAILILVPLTDAIAQEPLLQRGQRVRVTAPAIGVKRQAATFNALRGDTLVVVADTIIDCPLEDVTRLDVHRGRKSWGWWKGALIGFLGGGGIGAGIGAASCDPSGDFYALCPLIGSAVGAGAGMLLGVAAGVIIKTDRWVEVPLLRLRLSAMPRHDGVGIAARIAF